jgi:hypothetical protein
MQSSATEKKSKKIIYLPIKCHGRYQSCIFDDIHNHWMIFTNVETIKNLWVIRTLVAILSCMATNFTDTEAFDDVPVSFLLQLQKPANLFTTIFSSVCSRKSIFP